MKHFINIATPITYSFIKDYVVDECSDTDIDYVKTSQAYTDEHIFITEDAYNKYKDNNKIYYMHLCNLVYYLNYTDAIKDSVINILFLYIPKDNTYHICQILDPKEPTHLIDITVRLTKSFEYWSNFYLEHSFLLNKKITTLKSDDIINTIIYFYNTSDEALKSSFKYLKHEVMSYLSVINTEYILYNTDYTYERMYNKIYDEHIEQLKDNIKKELESNKQYLIEDINEYNKILKNIDQAAYDIHIEI